MSRRSSRSVRRVRYAFDELNRLTVASDDGRAEAPTPTRILEGRVSADRRNRLVYRIDAAGRDGLPGRHRVKLDGTWGLSADHGLTLTLHETARGRRQRLFLKGAIEQAEAHALIVALRRHALDGRRTVQRLTLSGRWQADRRNRLRFLVDKADGAEDPLTFQGAWQVDRHHELVYRYRQQRGARTRPVTRTLRFQGAWDLAGANRLVYALARSDTSRFEFRASLQTRSLSAREGRIAYQVGIGLAGGRTWTTQVVLFGRWKLNRDLSIAFEIPYAQGRRQAVRFLGTVALTSKTAVTVQLRTEREQPLGLSVTFMKQFLEDAQLFLRLKRRGRATEALAGVQVRF